MWYCYLEFLEDCISSLIYLFTLSTLKKKIILQMAYIASSVGKVNRSKLIFLLYFNTLKRLKRKFDQSRYSFFVFNFSFSLMSKTGKCPDPLGNVSTVWEKHLQRAWWTTRRGLEEAWGGGCGRQWKEKLGAVWNRTELPNLQFTFCII